MLTVELHWALVDSANLFKLPGEEVFARVRWLADGGPSMPALALEDELIYLIIHLAKHAVLNPDGLARGEPAEWFCRLATGNRLRWYLDIHALLRKYGGTLDWDALRGRIDAWNVAGEVARTLAVLELLASDAVGASAIERLGLALPAARRARAGSRGSLSGSRVGRRVRSWLMGTIPGLTLRPVRLLTVWRLLIPAPEAMRRYYGTTSARHLTWRYLAHPFHLLRKVLG